MIISLKALKFLKKFYGGDMLQPSDLPKWAYAIMVTIFIIIVFLMILAALPK